MWKRVRRPHSRTGRLPLVFEEGRHVFIRELEIIKECDWRAFESRDIEMKAVTILGSSRKWPGHVRIAVDRIGITVLR